MDLANLTQWLKLPQGVLWGLVVVSALMLWGPDWFISGLGLQSFIDAYRKYIGVVFLLFLAAALPNALHPVGQEALKRWRLRRWMKNAKRRLHDLTDDEKKILNGYVRGNTRTQSLELSDGVASGLVAAQVIFRASSVGVGLMFFPYNIQEWAWNYLREHPELLR